VSKIDTNFLLFSATMCIDNKQAERGKPKFNECTSECRERTIDPQNRFMYEYFNKNLLEKIGSFMYSFLAKLTDVSVQSFTQSRLRQRCLSTRAQGCL